MKYVSLLDLIWMAEDSAEAYCEHSTSFTRILGLLQNRMGVLHLDLLTSIRVFSLILMDMCAKIPELRILSVVEGTSAI